MMNYCSPYFCYLQYSQVLFNIKQNFHLEILLIRVKFCLINKFAWKAFLFYLQSLPENLAGKQGMSWYCNVKVQRFVGR